MADPLKKNESRSSRRNWLKNVGLLGAASMAPSLVLAAPENEKKKSTFTSTYYR
jgi:hypothetical protein